MEGQGPNLLYHILLYCTVYNVTRAVTIIALKISSVHFTIVTSVMIVTHVTAPENITRKSTVTVVVTTYRTHKHYCRNHFHCHQCTVHYRRTSYTSKSSHCTIQHCTVQSDIHTGQHSTQYNTVYKLHVQYTALYNTPCINAVIHRNVYTALYINYTIHWSTQYTIPTHTISTNLKHCHTISYPRKMNSYCCSS